MRRRNSLASLRASHECRGSCRHFRRLWLEILEDRRLLSVLTVTDTSDSASDTGSLRYAILNAQNGDTIGFDIPATDPGYDATTNSWTIEPASPLPAITNSILIDGFSQPGYSGTPVIELYGSQAGTSNGLTINGSGVTVRGLDVGGFSQGAGILISGSGATGNWVYGSFLGTDPTGTLGVSNMTGIQIDSGASGNLIGTSGQSADDPLERNVVSGNSVWGILVEHASMDNVIAGNYIGTTAAGTAALANGTYGAYVGSGSQGNWVGVNPVYGPETSDQRNIISGNGQYGVFISGQLTTGNTVAGNYVGTDPTGTVALPNYAGVRIQNQASGNLIGTNGDGVSDALERNIISGNAFAGVWLSYSGTNDVVAGNYIGTDVTGELALGNAVGVWLNVASDDWVGVNSVDGPENADEGNLISANYYFGVELDAPASNDVIAGNDVGSNADGTTALSNGGFAIVFTGGSDNVIGLPGAGNLISAANDSAPIVLSVAFGTVVQANRIGTTADGMAVLPGQFSGEGILVENSPDTLIGGTTPGTGNLISIGPWNSAYVPASASVGGFIWNADGIDVVSGFDSTATSAGTVIEGNLIGTDAAGEEVLGNPNFGIALVNASDITIGGTSPGAANVIAGNSQGGVAILSGASRAWMAFSRT